MIITEQPIERRCQKVSAEGSFSEVAPDVRKSVSLQKFPEKGRGDLEEGCFKTFRGRQEIFMESQERIGVRTAQFLEEWDKIKGGSLIRLGAHASWTNRIAKESLRKKSWEDGATRISMEQRLAFRNVFKEQLETNIDSAIPLEQVSFRNNVFLIRKKSVAWCQILDCLQLFALMKKSHFKCENERSVERLIEKRDFAITLDFSQAYYSIPISKDLKPFLCFRLEGKDN